MARPSSLSAPASELVLRLLHKSDKPLTAYEILDALKPEGINSAPIIYRALDSLQQEGKAHKIKELGAFVACECDKTHHHALSVLTICEDCHKVAELHDHKVIHQLENLRKSGVRIAEDAVIELPIKCDDCTN